MIEPKGLRVLVAGGGIAGLSAAIVLRQNGHEVEVFEKSRLQSEVGAAMHCAPNCTAALSHIALDPKTFGAVEYRGFKFLDLNCQVTATKTNTKEEHDKWIAEWYLINRIDLHNALKQTAVGPDGTGQPIKLHASSAVSSVDCESGSITLSDGQTFTGDLVVCADGVHSKTRECVTGHEVPVFGTGLCCYRWLFPTSMLLDDAQTRTFADAPGHLAQISGSDRRIVFYPCAAGKAMNCAAFVPRSEVGDIKKGNTGYDQSANKQQLISHFKSFSAPVQRMLDMAPADNVMLWDLADMELQASLIKGKALLIGDAAHPFAPHLGQGGAQAVEDAVALGPILPLGTTPEDIPQRLGLWQRCRMARAHKIVEDTRHRARPEDGSQGEPQTLEEFDAAIQFAINHDTWKNAEEEMRASMNGTTHNSDGSREH